MTRLVATVQGVYYISTGIWPFLSMATFEAVTGPKADHWLVHTVGVLVIVIGLVLLAAAIKLQIGLPVVLLAAGSAAGLASIEFYYGIRGMIWPVYLLDAIGEAALILLWAVGLWRDGRRV